MALGLSKRPSSLEDKNNALHIECTLNCCAGFCLCYHRLLSLATKTQKQTANNNTLLQGTMSLCLCLLYSQPHSSRKNKKMAFYGSGFSYFDVRMEWKLSITRRTMPSKGVFGKKKMGKNQGHRPKKSNHYSWNYAVYVIGYRKWS